MTSSKDKKLGMGCSRPSGDDVVGKTASIEIKREIVSDDGTVRVVTEKISSFDFYSCEEAIKRLNDYLDSELDPAEREDVIKHLKICNPCLERFDFEQNLVSALRDKVKKAMAPLKLKERMAAMLKTDQ